MNIPYLFFDLESTGKNPTTDRIIQLCAVKKDADFKDASDWKNVSLNPTIPISPEATAVHGITDEMVSGLAPFASYAKALYEFFSEGILAGYNIKAFDIPLLSEEFARCGYTWPLPGMKIVDAYKIFSIKERRDLTYAVKFYTGEEFKGAHDAEADVDATINVLAGQLSRYPDLKAMSIDELETFCNEGVRSVDLAGKIVLNDQDIPCYAFGKSKGVPVVNDRGFGEWMLKNDFTTDTKNVIKSLIYKTSK